MFVAQRHLYAHQAISLGYAVIMFNLRLSKSIIHLNDKIVVIFTLRNHQCVLHKKEAVLAQNQSILRKRTIPGAKI